MGLMGFFSRFTNLVRGWLGEWMGRRERRNPAAVYEAAIGQRLDQYGKLREATASILYLRNKLGRQLDTCRAELGRIQAEIPLAVDRDDDEAALFLIGRRDRLAADIERITGELGELNREAEAAKQNLTAFQGDIQRLREEKTRMLARLANAQARLRLQRAVNRLTPDADIQALEAVREDIERTIAAVAEAHESGDASLDERLEKIRADQATQAARAQLDELKRSRRRLLLPMIRPRDTAGVVGG
jgi:phage shock protein A